MEVKIEVGAGPDLGRTEFRSGKIIRSSITKFLLEFYTAKPGAESVTKTYKGF